MLYRFSAIYNPWKKTAPATLSDDRRTLLLFPKGHDQGNQ
ncbi:hypothetical protein AB434_0579 [Heyndrickxia coagulans]|uniref:Uncharacterized protein n=1 Tax=Heyndrickxia coagulans TaxID=1398 RepID=A0AAN0WA48_HEYCO|nr:hypothetical protein SB48_HM08orf00915 [Heyndrickxia coagulans]AKN52984.1 hypothetical protein AB434_0579 [Heyndrickxia coagulans]KYC59547.1 hypothetical protein B4100_1894 [Heyndrickxia coagulans]KYC70481.1 hypothetical protein B4096_1863 [Heyndrickxia coagulans]